MKRSTDWLVLVIGAVLACLLTVDIVGRVPHRPPSHASAVDSAALGRAYAPVVVATLADAWAKAADALVAGKTVAETQFILQENWKDGRTQVFHDRIAPGLAKFLPEGTEPKDDTQRAEVADAWRAFARGLKGGK